MKTVLIYSKSTGEVLRRITCPDDHADLQTLDGESYILPDDVGLALFRQRGDSAVRIVNGAVSAYTPDSPESDGLTAYTWNETTFRWDSYRTTDGIAYDVRAQRDSLLSDCDWVVAKALEAGSAVPADWKTYRQALRDVPLQSGFPSNVTWPTKPE